MRENRVFVSIFLLRRIKAVISSPSVINVFQSVDFSGRRPKEVTSIFWRSMYIMKPEAERSALQSPWHLTP